MDTTNSKAQAMVGDYRFTFAGETLTIRVGQGPNILIVEPNGVLIDTDTKAAEARDARAAAVLAMLCLGPAYFLDPVGFVEQPHPENYWEWLDERIGEVVPVPSAPAQVH